MAEEDHLLTQWTEKRQQVDVTLSHIEEQAENFAEIPSNVLMIEAAIEENDVSCCFDKCQLVCSFMFD